MSVTPSADPETNEDAPGKRPGSETGRRSRRSAFPELRRQIKVRRNTPPQFAGMDASLERPTIRGKYFFAGRQKLWVRGVTYGAFQKDELGREYTNLDRIDQDFAQMAASSINAVRIPHTTPPREVLDIAWRYGLRVMVGLSAEQYAGYLIDRADAPDIDEEIRAKVKSVAGHPALLCYGLGNEIQAPIARWIGRRRLEKYLERLYRIVKSEDPTGLVTYVNYPSTEYLALPFLDFLCFNVYLESRDRLGSYLARLQNLAGDRPLMMGELGLDSMRNGEQAQAESLSWQITTSFAAGCAGTFVFSWTDDWFRGKERVEDWAFGLTTVDRKAKPALAAVSRVFSEMPFISDRIWPRISVVVCTHNGAATLNECLDGLARLNYPDYEVIVVNDGSRDASAAIASKFNVRLITTPNMGLSSARNTGLEAATGEIVAYIDDDAVPDADWLKYLADTFVSTRSAAVGGPNIAPGDGRVVANAVENAPGGPVHVLLSDRIAEHIPGCNMAFRREALLQIGGFDTQFRTAGDDVDVCWRLIERGWTIGFNAGAVVSHHRRKTVRAYWKQQWGYGRAEARLEKKWPEKYNSAGHVTWGGRLYGKGLVSIPGSMQRIYHGVWGVAPFQLLYQPHNHSMSAIPMMPEWYLAGLIFAAASVLGLSWSPLLAAVPLLGIVFAASVIRAGASAAHASFAGHLTPLQVAVRRLVTTLLFFIQPMARLGGRIRDGLTPWRSRTTAGLVWPWPRGYSLWTSQGLPQEERLAAIEAAARAQRVGPVLGGAFDKWDIEVPCGLFGAARLRMAVEEHGGGHQFVRMRIWPMWRRLPLFVVLAAGLGLLAMWARLDAVQVAANGLALAGILLSVRAIYDFSGAMAFMRTAVAPQVEPDAASAGVPTTAAS